MKQEFPALLLSCLWLYSGIAKLHDWNYTVYSMHNQVFPEWMANTLALGLPVLELVLAIMLMFGVWRRIGYILSGILLSLFNGYILLIMTLFFGRIPCSCGGLLSQLGWWDHLIFNCFFLAIAYWGYSIDSDSTIKILNQDITGRTPTR